MNTSRCTATAHAMWDFTGLLIGCIALYLIFMF
jgi:hypothetical protein